MVLKWVILRVLTRFSIFKKRHHPKLIQNAKKGLNLLFY